MLPLEGLLVVSVEQALAAPLASCRLADAGARVIKVERPEGDFGRGYDKAAKGQSSYFVWLNRGKESIALDVKQADDKALLLRMIAKADIFIQNLLPGAAARSGFGSAALRQRHPRLITCDITGYGEQGPYRDRKAYDLLIQAEAGLAAISGDPAGPGRVGISIADISCGEAAHAAILQALILRGRTGEGSAIKLSLFDSLAEWMAVPLLHHDYGGKAPRRVGLNHPSVAPYGVFEAEGGRQILISIQNEREWATFCTAVLHRPELASDPRFAGNAARVQHRSDLDGAIQAVFGTLAHGEAVARMEQAGIAFGDLNGVEGLSAHPHLRRLTVATPAGPIDVPAPPARHEPWPVSLPAIDEHGAALRAEFAAG